MIPKIWSSFFSCLAARASASSRAKRTSTTTRRKKQSMTNTISWLHAPWLSSKSKQKPPGFTHFLSTSSHFFQDECIRKCLSLSFHLNCLCALCYWCLHLKCYRNILSKIIPLYCFSDDHLASSSSPAFDVQLKPDQSAQETWGNFNKSWFEISVCSSKWSQKKKRIYKIHMHLEGTNSIAEY